MNSYKKYAKNEIDKNIEKLIYADIYNGIGWGNYNFKRSLCIENEYKQHEIIILKRNLLERIQDWHFILKVRFIARILLYFRAIKLDKINSIIKILLQKQMFNK